MIEFPPALLLAWSLVDVTWVCAPTYEDLGRKYFLGGGRGRVLEVRIFMEVGVAFRKKYSVTVNNIGGGRVSHMFGARGMLVILLCGKVPYVV